MNTYLKFINNNILTQLHGYWRTKFLACGFFIWLLFSCSNLLAQQLPSCRSLSQFLTNKANPGVNCLGDCRAMPGGVSANNGVNCLFDCANLAPGVTAQPGGNCAYKINGALMPFCNSVPSPIGYSNTSSYTLGAGIPKKPRVNCADLIDLPLCTLFPSNAQNKINCVAQCSALNPATLDNRLHNRDCIRFCQGIEDDASDQTCINRRCHQYINFGSNPLPDCESITNPAISCTDLTDQELNQPAFYSSAISAYKYCNADEQCLKFNNNQLDAIKSGFNLASSPKAPVVIRLCKLHYCRTNQDSSCAPHDKDDISKITENSAYNIKYIQSIISPTYPSFSNLNALCITKICSGKITLNLACNPDDKGIPKIPDSKCHTICENNYCKREIDCDSINLESSLKNEFCSSNPLPQSPVALDHTNSHQKLINKSYFYLPKPMNKSYIDNNPSNDYRAMQKDNLCYSLEDLETNKFAHRDNVMGGLITSIMNAFSGKDFEPIMTDYADCPPFNYSTRSPTYCNPGLTHGNRGIGYSYLCGGPDFNSKPNMDFVGYIDNISSSWNDSGSTSKVRACIRYNNSMIPGKTCGSRECGITCAWGDCSTVCGFDECRELTLSDNNPRECIDPTSSDKDCSVKIGSGADMDSYIRLRAVGFTNDNRVCVMLDWKGGLAYNKMFANGSEALPEDPTKCLSGTYNATQKKCINGKNSNDDEGQANVWRSLGLIKYIDQNVTVNGVKGIKDVYGNFYPEANCIRRQLRVSPPNLFNLANYQNSPNLFSPQIIINRAMKKKGGAVSNAAPNELFGTTDFNQPEVEIAFGETTTMISLDIGKNGSESGVNIDPESVKTISTTAFGRTFTAKIYAKKMYDQINGPKFCIFRELRDRNNALITPPPSIGCVKRNLPIIDSCDLRDGRCITSIDRTINRRKLMIYKDTTPALDDYDRITVKYRYMINYTGDINGTTCGSGGVLCTNEINQIFNITEETKKDMSYCVSIADGTESYPICLHRDDCSMLNMECMKNEILFNSSPLNPIDSVRSLRDLCKEKLKSCNLRKNISVTSFDPSRFNQPAVNNYYGWFNEVCIRGSFDHNLKLVYAYKINDANGKCIVLPSASSLPQCATGGKMPDCPCTPFVETDTPPAHIQAMDQATITTRRETYREAGLCVDISPPKTCPSIYFTEGYDINEFDPFFVSGSVGKQVASGYNNVSGVHLSHQLRTNAIYGNAEFPSAIVNSSSLGKCVGFWKHKEAYGGELFPELRCTLNASGVAVWNASLENPSAVCQRYSCPAILNPVINNSTGLYSSNYGSHESLENKGSSNGNAYWPANTQTTDFATLIQASGCIVGFRNVGATTNFNYSATPYDIPASYRNSVNASLFGVITSYSGGTIPSRLCNQVGEWQSPSNSCVRISCPAVNPGTAFPSNSDDRKLWSASWERSGGAKFSAINASRSTTEAITFLGLASRQSGSCETNLGYYQASGAPAPSFDCDSNGNWTNLQNPCLTDCSAIDQANTNDANGWATWDKATLIISQPSTIVNGSCNRTNYFNYPYPPRRKDNGEKFDLVSSGANYSTSIPQDVNSDTRSTSAPRRTCTKSIFAFASRSQWSGPSSTCVTIDTSNSTLPNKCVTGFDSDSYLSDERINAGVTQHRIWHHNSGDITINVRWESAPFGQYIVKYCDHNNGYCTGSGVTDTSNSSYHNSNTYYQDSRGTGFAVSRYCNPSTRKWDAPVHYCVAYGDIGNNLNASATVSQTGFNGANSHYFMSPGSVIAMSCNHPFTPYLGNTPYLRCDSNNTYVNRYNLVKNDGNFCARYCDINADGTIPGTSYTYLRGPAGRYYKDNTATFSCTGLPCNQQTVTATCTEGGWSIPEPRCRVCRGCNNNSPLIDFGDPWTTNSHSNGCAVEKFKFKCILERAKIDSKLPSIAHGRYTYFSDRYCTYCSALAGNRCIEGLGQYQCQDGSWNFIQEVSTSAGYSWQETSGDCTAW